MEAKRSGLKFSAAGTLSSEVRGSREQHTVTIIKASGATYYYEGVGDILLHDRPSANSGPVELQIMHEGYLTDPT